MKKNEKGFGVIGVLVIVVVLAVIGLAGWKVWHDNHKKKTTVATHTTPQKPTTKNDTSNVHSSTPATTTGTIDIQDWGVKVASLHNSSDIQFKMNTAEGSANAEFKPGVLKDESCQPGLALLRAKTAFTAGIEQKKIGDYYYEITGAPGGCSNDADTALRTQFYKDFVLDNVSAM